MSFANHSFLGTESSNTDPGSPLLRVSDIDVRFGGLVALDGVTLEVQRESIVGLVGPNGAGKSTLFNVISGFLNPQAGKVKFAGGDVSGASAQTRSRLGMTRTFQHPELFAEMTIREHLILARRMRTSRRRTWSDLLTARGLWMGADGGDSTEDREAIDELLESLDLSESADRMAAGLPLGVARRVELARALVYGPSLLLLDEPSSGLDSAETEQFTAVLIEATRRHHVSILIVEHDVDMVLGMSSDVYVLDFGQIIAHGTPHQIRNDPAVKAAYLGDDPTTTGSNSHA